MGSGKFFHIFCSGEFWIFLSLSFRRIYSLWMYGMLDVGGWCPAKLNNRRPFVYRPQHSSWFRAKLRKYSFKSCRLHFLCLFIKETCCRKIEPKNQLSPPSRRFNGWTKNTAASDHQEGRKKERKKGAFFLRKVKAKKVQRKGTRKEVHFWRWHKTRSFFFRKQLRELFLLLLLRYHAMLYSSSWANISVCFPYCWSWSWIRRRRRRGLRH